jgi:hypothetical protein
MPRRVGHDMPALAAADPAGAQAGGPLRRRVDVRNLEVEVDLLRG